MTTLHSRRNGFTTVLLISFAGAVLWIPLVIYLEHVLHFVSSLFSCWILASVFLFGVRGLIWEIRYNRPWYTLSLLTLFGLVAWSAVGLMSFNSCRAGAIRYRIQEVLNLHISGRTGSSFYEAYCVALEMIDTDVTPSGNVPQGSKYLSLPEMYEEGRVLHQINEKSLAEAQKICLHTDTAKELYYKYEACLFYAHWLLRDMRPIAALSEIPDPSSLESLNSHYFRLCSASRELDRSLTRVLAVARGFSLTSSRYSRPVALRLALVEVQRWPGLSEQEFQIVAEKIDTQPLIAQLLLADYACRNGERRLVSEEGSEAQKTTLRRLRENEFIQSILP